MSAYASNKSQVSGRRERGEGECKSRAHIVEYFWGEEHVPFPLPYTLLPPCSPSPHSSPCPTPFMCLPSPYLVTVSLASPRTTRRHNFISVCCVCCLGVCVCAAVCCVSGAQQRTKDADCRCRWRKKDSATTTTCCVRQPVTQLQLHTHTAIDTFVSHGYRYTLNAGTRRAAEAFVSPIACCILYVWHVASGKWQLASGEGIPLTQITQSRAASRVHPSDTDTATLQTREAQEQSVQYRTDKREMEREREGQNAKEIEIEVQTL